MKRYWALAAVLMLAAAAPTQPTQCVQSPGPSVKLPPNYTVYRTTKIETPYSLAQRFYDHGYMEYKIREANFTLLTKEGMFPPGTAVLVPPDQTGRPVDLTRLTDRNY